MKQMTAVPPQPVLEVAVQQEQQASQLEAGAKTPHLVPMDAFRYAGSPLQRVAADAHRTYASPAAGMTQKNPTGLPDSLKSGIESLSGMSLDHVKVHYNSSRPAQLNALAYAQGADIHLAPGQAQHLPHEAWHVVQQAQGRVKPTLQMKNGAPINDDQGLEREADLMGARAAAISLAAVADDVERSPAVSVGTGAVLQGVFPDSLNEARAKEQSIPKKRVQLDHMVSQARLKAFSETYRVLLELTGGGTKWEETVAAMKTLREQVNTLERNSDHVFMSESHLVNMMENIVPGRRDQVQGAGNEFDPQVAVSEEDVGANLTRYAETEQSKQQRRMDTLIVRLNNFVHQASLPTKPGERNKSGKYNPDTDEFLAEQIEALAETFTSLGQAPISNYAEDVWDHPLDAANGVSADKWVKKRPADWIKNPALLPQLGEMEVAPQTDTQTTFTFETKALKGAGNAKLVPVAVSVTVDIPEEAWKHIYERHYLPTFAGTVEAVNTFWKEDPRTFLTGGVGQALMATELQKMLERSFNYSRPYDSAEDSDGNNVSWSHAAEKLFFQGNAESDVTKSENPDSLDYNVTVTIKSIAPQDQALAYAIKPASLRADYDRRHPPADDDD